MFVDDLFNKKTLTENHGGGSPWHAEPEQGMAEAGYKRDAYQRDYDNSVAGMGKRQSRAYQDDGGANDERHDLDPSDWYFVKDGKMFAISVYPNQEQQAISLGYSRTRAEAKAKADQQGVAEGLGKTIKRGMAGWGAFDKDKPADVVKRVRGQDTDTLKGLSNRGSTGKGSPAELQQKAISRELKKRGEQGVAEGQIDEVFNIVPNLAQQIEKKEDELKALKAKMASRTATNAGIQTGATALIDPETGNPYEKDKLASLYGYKEPEAAADDAQADETPPAPVAQTPAQIRAAKQKAAAATAQGQMSGNAPAPVAQTPAATTATPTPTTNPAGFNAANVMKLPGMEKYAKPAEPAKTANFAGPGGYGKITTSIKPPAAPSSPALAAPKAPAAPNADSDQKLTPDQYIKRIAAPALPESVAETIAQVERMLESVNSKKSAEMVRAYVDQKFTELGLRNTTECRTLMAHVVQESAIRRRQHAKSLAN
jgi:hypothetical protein